MGKLVNEFTWSPSRDRLYQMCAHAYYLHYYGSWGGWDRRAPKAARQAYRLKQMTTLPMLAGTVVHAVIEDAIGQIRRGGVVERDAMLRQASARMNRAWRESRGEAWRHSSPKKVTTLIEHYYGEKRGGPAVGAEVIAEIKSKIRTCIDHYLNSEIHQQLLDSRGATVRSCEQLSAFQLHDTKIWVAMDLVCAPPDDAVTIYDWKSGEPRDADTFQLRVYGLYAAHEWGISPSKISARAFYLVDGQEKVLNFDQALLDRTSAEVAERIAAARGLLADPQKNFARIEDFPRVEDRRVCARCAFQEICYPPNDVGV